MVHFTKSVNKIFAITATMRNSLIVYEKFRPETENVSLINNTIINASAPLKLHRANKCCQTKGIGRIKRKEFKNPMGRYTLIALAITVTTMSTQMGMISCL